MRSLSCIWASAQLTAVICLGRASPDSSLAMLLPTWKLGTTAIVWAQILVSRVQPSTVVLRITLTASLVSSQSQSILERASANMLVFPTYTIPWNHIRPAESPNSDAWHPVVPLSGHTSRGYYLIWLWSGCQRYSWNTIVMAYFRAKTLVCVLSSGSPLCSESSSCTLSHIPYCQWPDKGPPPG